MEIEVGENYNAKRMLSPQVFTVEVKSERRLGLFGYYRYCQWVRISFWENKSNVVHGVIRERNILYKV